ncbi:tryptophan synthase subunit alpha [Desulfotomaculum sp. 1211_IL3151]|uniref:tryptophan synthase subunit alpha n=1 Tax=Desulfotomaculum sp. 1211_IL3151 TaxID=3084055 RepID=UPI002FD8F1B2
MNRITKAFGAGRPFIGFITGGDPSVEKTEEFILDMIEGGADIVEIGIPFSDPIAEGPTIQAASLRALQNGTNVDKLFDMVASLRLKTQIPLLFMTYLNPVFHYGYERFFARCQACGLDGIIIPDLPYEERQDVEDISNRYGIALISMVAPTSKDRISQIVQHAQGFIYTVSSMGVTGVRSNLDDTIAQLVQSIKKKTPVPVAVGFGISTPEQARAVVQYADGVIVGSALVNIIASHKEEAGLFLREYVQKMKAAMVVQE